MRTIRAVALFLCLSAASLQPAAGQEACAPDPAKLGVSRTISIDTAPGPSFGGKYKGGGLLKNGEVVLTFDDGPLRPTTRPILDALAAQCTKATFFMRGRMALADPALVKEVARRGHTVATHTWSHGNLHLLSPQEGEAEIELGLSAVQQALGKPIAPFFRFPYLRDTAASLEYVRGRHLAAFAIDVDSRDFESRDADLVNERVLKDLAARGKGIVLLHDIHASTAKAVPALLAALKERGYRVVHLRPRAGAETLEDYDTAVRQEAERRRLAARGHPLAKRSITWPATGLSPEAMAKSKEAPSTVDPDSPEPTEEDWAVNIWRQ
jgi:peptidoglycan/xylan/chitin deacetylase (PgdA/CDA1 family)